MREDHSADGDAWSSFPHDHARSGPYRWSEDGRGGICDDRQVLCQAFALWNGRDPVLKERVFGDRQIFERDPAWRDALLLHEDFHGDDWAGLGASHQTGWTGLVADMVFRLSNARRAP